MSAHDIIFSSNVRMAAPGHEGWFLPESLNGGCWSSKEISAQNTPRRIRNADSQTLMTSPSSLRRRVNDPWN
jgi:hypothetical protein